MSFSEILKGLSDPKLLEKEGSSPGHVRSEASFLEACEMTTNFLDNQNCTFKILLS